MKKILELFGEPFWRGGQESFAINVFQTIDSTNLKIDFCTPYNLNSDDYQSIIENKNERIYGLNMRYNPGGFRFKEIKPVSKLIKEENYDVVHIHSGSVMALAILSIAAKIAGTPNIIVHSHSTGDKNSLKHKLTKIICTPILNVCPTDYFACSKDAAEWKFSKSIVKNKVKIIKNGIDLNKFKIDNNARKVYREKLGYSENDKVLGHVGRFSDEKNHRFIINLFSELKKESDKYKLLLVGDGELRSEIEEYAKQKGVFENIIFTGNVNNVQDYMQAMDLFILPSKFEGLPLVGVEAQASGLPVIFSSGVPTEAKITENVRFIPVDDLPAWKSEIKKMISLPRVNNIPKIKSEGYDIKQTADLIKNIYGSQV